MEKPKNTKCKHHGLQPAVIEKRSSYARGFVVHCKLCRYSPERRAKTAEWYRARRDVEARKMRERHAAVRAEVIAAYGSRCACCGEDEPKFLEIDHVNGGGHEHRKKLGGGPNVICRWLRDHGFPKDEFRLLCANCNRGRERNHGRCPHEWRPRAVAGYCPE